MEPVVSYAETSYHSSPGTYFAKAIDFIKETAWLHDFKLTRFFVDDIYNRLPEAWYEAFEDLDDHLLQELLTATADFQSFQVFHRFPESLSKFLRLVEEFSLHRECKARTPVIPANLVGKLDFTSLIPQEDAVLPLPRNLAYGMSPKKQHEVSNLAYLVNGICQSQQLEYVVDLGSGMGYLDCILCDVYNLNVIAVECDNVRTESAEERVKRHTRKRPLAKRLHNRTLKIEAGKQCMEDLTDILDECGAGRVCMVGLHCCGDLTPLLMDIFSTLDRARALVCVGCCYHLMEYNKEETMIQNCPLSLLARQKWETVWGCKKLLLTPASLRLATQETKARWLEQLDSHAHCHFFRGILEAAANEGGFVLAKRRRHTSTNHGTSFDSFMAAVFKDYRFIGCDDLTEFADLIRKKHKDCLPHYRRLRVFRILQGLLQGTLESFIVLDRSCYLSHDKKICFVEVLPIFNPGLSPRNLALVAVK